MKRAIGGESWNTLLELIELIRSERSEEITGVEIRAKHSAFE